MFRMAVPASYFNKIQINLEINIIRLEKQVHHCYHDATWLKVCQWRNFLTDPRYVLSVLVYCERFMCYFKGL